MSISSSGLNAIPGLSPEREKAPDSFQRKQEREGNSEWSGGRWGGYDRSR